MVEEAVGHTGKYEVTSADCAMATAANSSTAEVGFFCILSLLNGWSIGRGAASKLMNDLGSFVNK